MTSLEEKKKNRWLMLRKFYEIANGQSDHIISMWEVGEQLGWDRETTNTTYDYLEGERLLKAMTLGGGATITHEGIKEVEEAEEHPEMPTLHFPRMIVYIKGDSYTIGQAGAVGPHAHAHDMNFNQIWNEVAGSIDLPQLAKELSKLRLEMKKEAIEPEQDIAVSEIAKAEQAAKSGNGSKTLEHLKSAGKWAFNIATKIGTNLAVEAIKKSMGP